MTLLSAAVLLSVVTTFPATVTEHYAPGQLIVELTPDCREQVGPAVAGELPAFGVPELDRLNSRWQVTRITKLIRDPHPSEPARQYHLDLLYLLTADVTTDVMAMMQDYGTSAEVAYACPNMMRPLDEVPNDPMYGSQWHLAKIQAAGAWDISHGDTNVRIGVIDDGVDYTHADIARNIWINELEDINHNHRFDPYPPPDGDLDDVDDDGNGYVDDVIGYDFVNSDPDPMPVGSDDHGTHCWGNTNAVTDNDTGVASIGWGCYGLGLKAGQGGSVYMAAAISAIYYSVEKSCWVTSHSYGSASAYPPERDAMDYAVSSGAVVVCAAGNDNVTSPHYPAAYENVVAVAASDNQDHRSLWGGGQGSNYGDWVEVTAPGTGILSTVPNNHYAAMDGTSMATPITAGLIALIKASEPGISNSDCLQRLYATCDTMPDPDYRAGLMGAGRINATKALAMSRRCWLVMTDRHLNDPSGNGIPEPGEVIGLTITLTNEGGWQTATSVSATLVCDDPAVSITKATATFPDIAGGTSAHCAADSFVFRTADDAVPHMVTFRVDKTATPASLAPSDYFTIQVGLPRVLLVDDYAGDDVAKWYRWACDSLRVLYHSYSVLSSGAPSADTLRHYPAVVWFTGLDSTNLLSGTCQTALTSFLDNGGKLFISGQNIGQAIGGSSLYTNYLRAQYLVPSTGKIFSLGLGSDPIGNGDTIVFGGAGGAGNARSNDGIKPLNGAYGSIIYKDYGDTTVYAAIRYSGNYQMVYFAAPVEAIDHATARYVQKWTILKRSLEYMGERLPGGIVEDRVATKTTLPLVLGPNPVRDRAEVQYSLSRAQRVTVRVYDTRGRLVKTLEQGERVPGAHRLIWNLHDEAGRAVASGIYFCSVAAGAESRTGKLLVTR